MKTELPTELRDKLVSVLLVNRFHEFAKMDAHDGERYMQEVIDLLYDLGVKLSEDELVQTLSFESEIGPEIFLCIGSALNVNPGTWKKVLEDWFEGVCTCADGDETNNLKYLEELETKAKLVGFPFDRHDKRVGRVIAHGLAALARREGLNSVNISSYVELFGWTVEELRAIVEDPEFSLEFMTEMQNRLWLALGGNEELPQ